MDATDCGCADENVLADGMYLFTTKTCPNCKIAKDVLDKAQASYKVVDAEENAKLTTSLGINSAPTLIIVKDGKAEGLGNVSEIRRYLSNK